MSTSRGVVITICAALLAFMVLGNTQPGPEPASVCAATTAAESELSPAQAAAFQQALQQSLQRSAASTLEAIEAQDQVLARIDSNIAEIAKREAAVEAAAAKEAATKEAAAKEVVTKEVARPEIVRRSTTIWNVEGSWNYTTEQLAVHLQNSHGLNADGYTREEMKIMHDNIHNGYSATGGTVAGGNSEAGTRSAVQTYTYYTKPQTQRRGLFQSIFGGNNNCPNGYCR